MGRKHLNDLWPVFGLINAHSRIKDRLGEIESDYEIKRISLQQYNHAWLKDMIYLGALWSYNIAAGFAAAAGAVGLIKILDN